MSNEVSELTVEVVEVLGGFWRSQGEPQRLALKALRAEQWRQAAADQWVARQCVVLSSLGDKSLQAIANGVIDLSALMQQMDSRAEEVAGLVANSILHLETLRSRNSDALDLHTLNVEQLRTALVAAYNAGRIDVGSKR